MITVSFEEFLSKPSSYLQSAISGQHCKVTTKNGNAAIVIDETEWTMLTQALKLCTEHPEWTISA